MNWDAHKQGRFKMEHSSNQPAPNYSPFFSQKTDRKGAGMAAGHIAAESGQTTHFSLSRVQISAQT